MAGGPARVSVLPWGPSGQREAKRSQHCGIHAGSRGLCGLVRGLQNGRHGLKAGRRELLRLQ
eukprot:7963032-Alexandrium_andersonii.AAC.1